MAITAALTSQTDVDGAQHSLLDLAAQLDAAIQKAQDALAADHQSGSDGQTPAGPARAPVTAPRQAAGQRLLGPVGLDRDSRSPGWQRRVGRHRFRRHRTEHRRHRPDDQGRVRPADPRRPCRDRPRDGPGRHRAGRRPALHPDHPVAGTVAQVALAVGDEVSASSTSAVVTVLGADGYVVETSVPLAAVGSLAVGQETAVTVSDDPTVRTGTVSSIGVLSTSTTSTPSTR
ncbi:hypothetical protein NKG05_07410 [Oerskovia sp. M15]